MTPSTRYPHPALRAKEKAAFHALLPEGEGKSHVTGSADGVRPTLFLRACDRTQVFDQFPIHHASPVIRRAQDRRWVPGRHALRMFAEVTPLAATLGDPEAV